MFGPIKSFSIGDENVVSNQMLEMFLSKDVFSTSWVKVDGVEYRAGLVVCSAIEKEMPVFCQISDTFGWQSHLSVGKQTIHREFCWASSCIQSTTKSGKVFYKNVRDYIL